MPPEAVREWFRTYGETPNWPVYYNAAPTTALPVVRRGKEHCELVLMQWGLVPWFSKDGKISYSTRSTLALKAYGPTPHIASHLRPGAALCRRQDTSNARAQERSTATLLHARGWQADGDCRPVGVILEPEKGDLWMKADPDVAGALMEPTNEDVLISRPVSKAVGNVKK
jgi:putative SOS response-associated peptidase YedK